MEPCPDNLKHKALLAELLQDASIDCILSLDTSLCITSWNKMCETLTGLTVSQMLGFNITEVLPQICRQPAMMQALQQALKGRKSFVPAEQGSFEGEYMESHVIPLRNDEGAVVGVLVIRHNVAHRQKAENELKQLNAALKQKAHELELLHAESVAFSKIMSHDLKEPLRKINVFTDMLISREKDLLSEEGVQLLQRLKRSAVRAETITDDIFSFSHLQQISEPLETVALDNVIKMVRLKLKAAFLEKEATLTAASLPVLTGYRQLLQQLFQNLIDNALKFSREEMPPCITLESGNCAGPEVPDKAALAHLQYHWVCVKDNGLGFEKGYEGRVFELFERLHPPEKFGGNGIGLSLCRKIMELHKGFITVHTAPDEGSAFTCYFPVEKSSGKL